MKFTCSTKPLSDALNLGVINSNVSKFYQKSCLAQVTASGQDLTINLEASRILSEIKIKGSSNEAGSARIFVDCMLFKQLVATLTSSTVDLEFDEGGLILHSGKSKFTLPKMFEEDDIELTAPTKDSNLTTVDLDKEGWKFVKDHQMYAIAMSFAYPVYTNVWVGSDSDVLVGDFDNSLFTHSNVKSLGSTCLLSDTIINLLNSVPDGAVIKQCNNKSYIISVTTDSYQFDAQFTPQYENDEDVGDYNSDIILDMINDGDDDDAISLSPAEVKKYLNQAELLATSNDQTISFEVEENTVRLRDNNVNCVISVENKGAVKYGVVFKTSLLKQVIGSYDDETVKIYPALQDGEVIGINIKGAKLTTVFAGVE